MVAAAALAIATLTACDPDPADTPAAARPTDAAAAPAHAATVTDYVPPTRADSGVDITDRDHGYHLLISPDWVDISDLLDISPAYVAWAIGPPSDGITPNVNVVTEDVGGMGLAAYIDLSLANIPRFMPGAKIGKTGKVKGLDGSPLVTVEYEDTDRGVRLIAVFTIGHGHAAIVTLGASPSTFEAVRDEAMPYLLTLTATD